MHSPEKKTSGKFQADNLRVEIHPDADALGRAAAAQIGEAFRRHLAIHPSLTAMFAAAPSQDATLDALVLEPVDWPRVMALHLDEYAGARATDKYSFRRYLIQKLVDRVPLGSFEGLRGEADDIHLEARRYMSVLIRNPPQIALLGIGENGHLAFNDPPAARFDDPDRVRVVKLTEACRVQQVHDRTFPNLEAVPERALTVTIPALFAVPQLFVMAPRATKAEAVRQTIEGPISQACPASILRQHPNATLFLDPDSASKLTALR